MSKWFQNEKEYKNTFDKNDPYCYLFSDTLFLKDIKAFCPERQWSLACGILFKEDSLRRYFASVITKKDHYLNIFIPTNTFFDQYHIYDHNYIENESVEVYWRDMLYSFSFNDVKDRDPESGKKYMATRGKIIKQTETHILLDVEKYLQSGSNHKSIQDDFRYLSIPKSYIRNFRKVGEEWRAAPLKKVIPKLDPLITEGKIQVSKLRNECEKFSQKYKNEKSFLVLENKINKKKGYSIDFSYIQLSPSFKYIGNINFNIFNKIKSKFFVRRLGRDKYIEAHKS